jgi:hypothetical protein
LKGNRVVIILITAFSIYENAENEEVARIFDRVIMRPFSLIILDAILSNYMDRFP